MRKQLKKLLITAAIAATTLSVCGLLAKPAEATTYAWTPGSYWGVNLKKMSQSDADNFCITKSHAYSTFWTGSPSARIRQVWVIHVWAHRDNNYCMINTY